MYTIFSKIALVQKQSLTDKVDSYLRWKILWPRNRTAGIETWTKVWILVQSSSFKCGSNWFADIVRVVNGGLEMRRTDVSLFTAGLSLSIARCDWQLTKALAVMKSYSEAEKDEKSFLSELFIYPPFFSHQTELKEMRKGSHFRLLKLLHFLVQTNCTMFDYGLVLFNSSKHYMECWPGISPDHKLPSI